MKESFTVPVSTEWMSATDAAELLDISRQQLNKMINWGDFPSTVKVGMAFNLKIDEVKKVKLKRDAAAQNKAT